MGYTSTEQQREYQREWHKKRVQRHQETVAELREGHSCFFCGESEQCCLDFHHLNPEEKEFNISSGAGKNHSSRMRTPESIRKEAEKCLILCANCHRKLHKGLLSR